MEKHRTLEEIRSLLPLKPLVFEILLVLHDGERHGYSIVKELSGQPSGRNVAPGNFYRKLRSMMSQGLIEESGNRPDPALDDERRRYFRLTETGRRLVAAEARRLDKLLSPARRRRLLSDTGGTH